MTENRYHVEITMSITKNYVVYAHSKDAAVAEAKELILDETDSGLDIDALQVVAAGVNAMRDGKRSFIVVTHYQRLLDYIVPDFVHVLAAGRIVKTGGKDLALELEARGYAWLEDEGA